MRREKVNLKCTMWGDEILLALIQIILVLGVIAALSSSKSTFHSEEFTVEFVAEAGARIGTKTGTPPLQFKKYQ